MLVLVYSTKQFRAAGVRAARILVALPPWASGMIRRTCKVPERDSNGNAVSCRGCPRNCNRLANVRTSTEARALGRTTRARTREPGDLPCAVVLLVAGVRL